MHSTAVKMELEKAADRETAPPPSNLPSRVSSAWIGQLEFKWLQRLENRMDI